jgi:hypothetical protein
LRNGTWVGGPLHHAAQKNRRRFVVVIEQEGTKSLSVRSFYHAVECSTGRMRRLFVLALVACAAPPRTIPAATTPPRLTWHLVVDEHLAVTETICWSGFAPKKLEPEMASGLRFARVVASPSGGCTTVVVDLDAMARELDDDASVTHVGNAVYGSFDPWLWRPDPWPEGLVGELTVDTPRGMTMVLPNARLHEGAQTVYAIPRSTWTFMTRMALGKLVVDHFDAGGTRLSLVRLPGTAPRATKAGLRRMIEGAVKAVSTVGGRMPVDEAQIVFVGTRRRMGPATDPVVFGTAMRGGGASVTLRLSESATDETLYGEWIATHELSHLLLPPVDRNAAWLSEGLASYWQCVLRSRAGILDEPRAWTELLAGFRRGVAQAGDLPLADARRPRYQQIYWGGAAIALKLDVELRRRGSSLDAAVTAVNGSAGRDPTRLDDVDADAMIGQLERASGVELRPIVTASLRRPFPDVEAELADLGIRHDGDSPVAFDDNAPLTSIRRGISGPR